MKTTSNNAPFRRERPVYLGSGLRLQLSSTGLLNTPDFLALLIRLLITIPSQSSQSLRQDRVREMVACIHPIRIHGAQVLDLELDQRAGQFLLVSQLLCELIGLELIAAAENVHEKLDDSVHWCECVGEEDESDDDGEFLVESEGLVEGCVVDEYREKGEDVEEMRL